jgi:hypothetical protein
MKAVYDSRISHGGDCSYYGFTTEHLAVVVTLLACI